MTEKSQQWYNILEIIQKTIKKPNEKVEWKIKTIEFIANPELQLCFQSKLRELRTVSVLSHSTILSIDLIFC